MKNPLFNPAVFSVIVLFDEFFDGLIQSYFPENDSSHRMSQGATSSSLLENMPRARRNGSNFSPNFLTELEGMTTRLFIELFFLTEIDVSYE